MKVITFAAQKGGAGKTAFAQHLSVLAETGGANVLLIDTDPQGSLNAWYQLRGSGTPILIKSTGKDLRRFVDRARKDRVDYCLVDTPPHAQQSILDAIVVSDLVVVPLRPAFSDLNAIPATLELAQSAGKAPLVVINQAPVASAWGEPAQVSQARELITGLGSKVAQTVIVMRVAIQHALAGGQTAGEFEPSGKAAAEIAALWAEIKTELETEK